MEDGRLAAELDDLYSRTQAQIEAVLGDGTLNRGLRVRAKAWLSAMRLPVSRELVHVLGSNPWGLGMQSNIHLCQNANTQV
eukprot:1150441-Pelagomonas_calceolata.AAC.6